MDVPPRFGLTSLLLQLAADAPWSGATIKYGMAPNPDRHKIVFACAYKFDMIPLAGSCSPLAASCFPMEVRKSARAPARALDASHAAAFKTGILHDIHTLGPHGQHGTVKGSGTCS